MEAGSVFLMRMGLGILFAFMVAKIFHFGGGIVTVAGLLGSRKGISAPGTDVTISSMTPKDRTDLDLIGELDFDYVALSFVRSAEDVFELRHLLDETGSIAYAIASAREHVVDALGRLECLPPSEAKTSLAAMAEFIVERRY